MVRQVVATPSREALECARLLRLDKTEAIYWALQFDSVAKSSIALSGRSQRIHAWLVYPVVFGSIPERMQILPGVSARVWLVTPEGYSLFFSVSRPVLSVDQLDELVRFLHRLSADLGHQSQHCRLETQIKRVTGIALSIKSVEWNMAELGCLRLGEYLTQQLFGRLSVLPAVRRQIVKLLHNRLLHRLEAEIRAMPQHLDAAVCHCLPTSDQAFDLSCYNRILGLAPADDAYRRQAFQVLPVLARLADDATRAALSAGRHARREPDPVQIGIAMLQAIDCGDPLFQTLKQLFQLPEEVFRWASRHAELIKGWPFDISILFRVLGAMAPELRPATDEQWLCMQNMVAAVVRRDLPIELACGWVKSSSRQGWQSVSGKAAASDLFNQLNQFADFFNALVFCVVHLADADGAAAVIRDQSAYGSKIAGFLLRFGLRRQLGWSQNWHRLLSLQDLRANGVQHDECWAALFEAPIPLGPDHVAMCLTSGEELIKEGELMEHCVGGYADLCRKGYRHIVSIRCRHTGRSLSTAELVLKADDRSRAKLEVLQHNTLRNELPDDGQRKLLHGLLLHLSSVDAQSRLDELFRNARCREAAGDVQPDLVSARMLAIVEQSLAADLTLRQLVASVFEPQAGLNHDLCDPDPAPRRHLIARFLQRFWPKLSGGMPTPG